jgi:hypothetical protein
MSHERFTRTLLVTVCLLLAGNLLALLRGTPKAAYAQDFGNKVYDIVQLGLSTNNQMERFINASASRGYRYKDAIVSEQAGIFVIMEKPAP